MVRFLADEDLDGRIIRGLHRASDHVDLVRAQDVGLSAASDEKVLEWAADNDRVVITQDKRTMPRYLYDRLASGLHVPGILIVRNLASIRQCIHDIQLVAECSEDKEWQDQIIYLPF